MATPRLECHSSECPCTTTCGTPMPTLSPITQARVRESPYATVPPRNCSRPVNDKGMYRLLKQALASCRSTLGGDHPDTPLIVEATSPSPTWLQVGDRRRASVDRRQPRGRVRVFGDERPETLAASNALAVAHQINSDVDTALTLAKQVAVQRSRTLGPEHVDTLTSRMVLALAMAAAGRVRHRARPRRLHHDRRRGRIGANHEHALALLECGESNGLLRRRSVAGSSRQPSRGNATHNDKTSDEVVTECARRPQRRARRSFRDRDPGRNSCRQPTVARPAIRTRHCCIAWAARRCCTARSAVSPTSLHDHFGSLRLPQLLLRRLQQRRPGRDHVGMAAGRSVLHTCRPGHERDRLGDADRRSALLLGSPSSAGRRMAGSPAGSTSSARSR